MTWSLYLYLGVVALVGAALAVFAIRNANRLMQAGSDDTAFEVGTLCAILVTGSFAIYGAFYVETSYFAYLDVGADTIDQYVLFYLDFINNLSQGTFSEWNFDFGLGMSTLSYQSWVLDPFNLVLIPAGLLLGTKHLSAILAFIQLLKIVLSGILFDRFLLPFCKTPLARIVGATLYAFCGFLSLWGQHYWLGTVPVVFMALLLACEKTLERWSVPRFLTVALLSCVAMGWSPYCGFMMLLGVAIIELLLIISRTSGEKAVLAGFKKVLTLAIPVFCGILLACVTLIPYALFLFGETSRISNGESLSTGAKAVMYATQFVPLRWIPMIFSRFLGTSLISTGARISDDLVPATESFEYVNCYELLVLGFSVAALILLLQFFHWAFTSLSRKDKVLVVVATLLVALFCFNNFLPALFNVFAEPKYRGAFTLCVPICMALAVGWEQRVQARKVALAPLAVGIVTTFAILAWSFINTANNRLLCAFYILLAVVFIALIALNQKASEKAVPVVSICLVLVLTVSTVADGFFNTNNRITATRETFPEATEPNLGTDTRLALEAIRAEDGDYFRLEKTYSDWTDYNDSFVEGYSGVSAYNSTNDGDVITFYRAVIPGILPFGSAYQIYQRDMDDQNVNNLLGVRYILSKEPLSLSSFEPYKQVGNVFIYRNASASTLSGRAATMSESEFGALDVAQRRDALSRCVVVPDSTPARQGNGTLSVQSITIAPGKDGVNAAVTAPQDLSACLAIANTSGWTVCVDGQPVDTYRADLGFIGFDVPQGTHAIEARYVPAGRSLGAMLSLAGIVCTVAFCLISRFMHRKDR